jgi:hypothetical protein
MARTLVLPTHSRHQLTPLYQLLDEDETALTDSFAWGSWRPIDFPEADDDAVYVVASKDVGRLDNLAVKFYGDPYLWWVIAHVNDIVNPLEMEVGVALRIPSRDRVFSALFQRGIASGVSTPQNTFGIAFGTANNANALGA